MLPLTVNGTSKTMSTKMLSREYNHTGATLNETDHAINFTYSFGDQENFFNISVSGVLYSSTLYVTAPANTDHVSANYTEIYFH